MPDVPAPDLALIDRLQTEAIAAWRPLVGEPGQRVALLDFPSHDNIGDSMIWAGERALLWRLGARVAYASDIAKFDAAEMRRRVPDGPVLLHGGGNFGDLYPYYQGFRERVVGELTDRRVVQLPQSVWFGSGSAAARANDVFAAHPDFTLLVRENPSAERCRRWLPDVRVRMSHDAAFGIGALRRPAARTDVVALLRRDQESAGPVDWPVGVAPEVVDWGLAGWRRTLDRALHVPGSLSRRLPPPLSSWFHPAVRAAYDAIARQAVSAGVALLGAGRLVVTDRLHAHVLCCLTGIPHVALDNTYGKIAAVAAHSSLGFSTATFASRETLGEALGARSFDRA